MTQTAKDIMDVLEQWAAAKTPIDPSAWVEAGMKMVALLGDETDKLYTLEQEAAQLRIRLLDEGMSVSEAKLRVEATDAYKAVKTQKSLIDRILETVRLSKLRGRIGSEEYKSN